MIAYLQNQPIIYLFRQKVVAYDKATEINLFSEVFFQTAKEQCIEFGVSSKRIRMGSKFLGSNIAWMSRYKLIYKTLELHCSKIIDKITLEVTLRANLKEVLKLQGDKVLFTHTSQKVKVKLQNLGTLISQLLDLKRLSKNAKLPNITESIYRTIRECV